MSDDRLALTKQVKEANDIVDVVGQYVSLRPAGGTFKGLCPFHSDNRPSFDVDPRRQRYRCWSCGKFGDVYQFVMEFEKVTFPEALDQLARRANIVIANTRREPSPARVRLCDALRWAGELYRECLLDDELAADARRYLGDRKLLGETVRKFGLGYAPLSGDWLARKVGSAPVPVDVLLEAGLIAESRVGTGYYDRFRDRVMFPIRDLRGQTVGFGGRILPTSAYASRGPKYYNSPESELFVKSEILYGLDLARFAAQTAGYLAVVEGYTDVLMAHQCGVGHVVATMGTALTASHVKVIRRFAPRVVLIYDADAGGSTGVDRALELFIRHDLELRVATLPDGLDPFDLLVRDGPDPFRAALEAAVDVLDYKFDQVLKTSSAGVDGARRAVEAVLGLMALAPDQADANAAIRRDLILTRVASRFGLREPMLRQRLAELREQARVKDATGADKPAAVGQSGSAPADPVERELLEVLLAEPALVGRARAEVPPDRIAHAGLRRLLTGLYKLQVSGSVPDLDGLRLLILDNPKLAEAAMRLQEVGGKHPDRPTWLDQILRAFRERDQSREAADLHGKLKAAVDSKQALELLKQIQQRA